MAVTDYDVSIELSPSPNDALGVRLVQSHTVITRKSDGATLVNVTEPNDTPDRAKATAANLVRSLDTFAASRAAFVDGVQELFPPAPPVDPDTLNRIAAEQLTNEALAFRDRIAQMGDAVAEEVKDQAQQLVSDAVAKQSQLLTAQLAEIAAKVAASPVLAAADTPDVVEP